MKKLLSILFAICSLFVFTGCEFNFTFGGSTPTNEPTPTPTPVEEK